MTRTYTDPLSGEVRDLSHEELITSRRPPDKRENQDFALAYVNAMPDLLAMDLQGNDLRVLLALVARMDFDQPMRLYQKEIAESLGTPYASFRRSMQHLRTAGAIFDVGTRQTLINPTLFWRGTKTVRWEWVLRLRQMGRLPERTIPIELDEQDRA